MSQLNIKHTVVLLTFSLVLSACGPSNYDRSYEYDTFYNSSDISFSIDTEELKLIQGHSILFSVDTEKSGIKITENCSEFANELSNDIPLIDNYSGEKCQQKYRLENPSSQKFCFHLKKRDMKNDYDDYTNIFNDTSGLITIDEEGNHHFAIINTDNDEENFFTYFSVENISPISCDLIK